MEIYFDWELLEEQKTITCADKLVFDEIKSFYLTRFKPLEERIDAARNGYEPAFIVLVLAHRGMEVHPVNISEENIEKLKDSIRQEDLAYLNTVILKKLGNDEPKGHNL
jgi:hypothetical protein